MANIIKKAKDFEKTEKLADIKKIKQKEENNLKMSVLSDAPDFEENLTIKEYLYRHRI